MDVCEQLLPHLVEALKYEWNSTDLLELHTKALEEKNKTLSPIANRFTFVYYEDNKQVEQEVTS